MRMSVGRAYSKEPGKYRDLGKQGLTVTSCSSGNGEWKWRERGELIDEPQEGRRPVAQALWDLIETS